MRLTKLGHACVRLDKDGAVLVIDPGAFSDPQALAGANAVLITHEHFDHIEPERLRAALDADPGLHLWSTAAVAEQFAHLGVRVHTVSHGDTFSAAGFDVHVYGSEHAVLHQDIPIIANVGFMLDGKVFHPGDALTVPEDPVETLLLPANAPWLKLSEMIDYGRAVAPRRGYTIHDALFSETGLKVLGDFLGMAGDAVLPAGKRGAASTSDPVAAPDGPTLANRGTPLREVSSRAGPGGWLTHRRGSAMVAQSSKQAKAVAAATHDHANGWTGSSTSGSCTACRQNSSRCRSG